jgi:hypothetical protein
LAFSKSGSGYYPFCLDGFLCMFCRTLEFSRGHLSKVYCLIVVIVASGLTDGDVHSHMMFCGSPLGNMGVLLLDGSNWMAGRNDSSHILLILSLLSR